MRTDDQLHLVDQQNRVLQRIEAPREVPEAVSPALGAGWITYASWLNNTGTPVSSFTSTWTVPRPPVTNSGQTIFFFNGIEPGDGSHILQPVLQWGSSAAGGGDYWSVASWYVGGGSAFHTTLVRVNPGDVLTGVMTLDSRNGNLFNYTSSFQGLANTALPVQNNPELTWCVETLEAYGIMQCQDYPGTDVTPVTAINIRTGGTTPSVNWSVNNTVSDCGQRTVVAVDGAADGEVELSCRGEAPWAQNDLTAAAGIPILAGGDPTGYTWAADSTQHVVFRGGDSHVHELWFNGQWNHNDLTEASGLPPVPASDLAGYTWDVDTTQHVVYRGVDGHIHELWFNGQWNHNDLTNASGGPPLSVGKPAGYTWDVDRTQHVVYRGIDGHIHELWFNGQWNHNDLTNAAVAPVLASGDPAGYTWNADNTQHVVYRGIDGHIHELWFNGQWNHNDLTNAA
ncbi:hypothetical protein ABZZ74_51480, partial [Streptomyces sp. NPDC006476]|uniref:hypothetical protein n=1 Tax=Streptomyces sp. NPDC006476 TaxID=3157175 RepID=UPI0033A456F7